MSQEVSEADFREFFSQFGRIVDATLMMDKDTGRPRGFGFVTFENESAVEAALAVPDMRLGDKTVSYDDFTRTFLYILKGWTINNYNLPPIDRSKESSTERQCSR